MMEAKIVFRVCDPSSGGRVGLSLFTGERAAIEKPPQLKSTACTKGCDCCFSIVCVHRCSVSYCPQGLWASGALGGRCSSEPSKRCSPSARSKTASMAGHWICCGHPLASATTGPRSSWPPPTCRAWRPIGSWYALLCRRHRLLEVLIAALAGCGTTRQSQRG